MRAAGAAAAVAVALAACGNSEAAAPEPTAPAITETAEPTPEPTEEPTAESSIDPADIPKVTLRGTSDEDLRRVAGEIFAFVDWLFANPDQKFRLSRAYAKTCNCYENLDSVLQTEFLDKDRRFVATSATRIDDFRVVERGSVVKVRVTYADPPAQVFEADQLVHEIEGFSAPKTDEWWFVVNGVDELSLIHIEGDVA